MDKFIFILFVIGLIMAAIFWLPEKLGLGLENSPFCLGVAFILAIVIVIWLGLHKS